MADLTESVSKRTLLQTESLSCPLCAARGLINYFQDRRQFLQCSNCKLVSVPAAFHLSAENERAEYDRHQNDPADEGYRQFLSRTLVPLLSRVSPNATGLDFGCGPGPTISVMAAEKGMKVVNYDLFYFDEPRLLTDKYDFITMTEVIEHLAEPRKVLNKLDNALKKGGILAIMTKRVSDANAFAKWHYKNDPTHIAFYSVETFTWIARNMGWRLEIVDKDVIFFHRES